MFAWKVPFYIYNVIIFFVTFFALGYKLFADWSIFYLKEMASESNDIIIIQLQKKKKIQYLSAWSLNTEKAWRGYTNNLL